MSLSTTTTGTTRSAVAYNAIKHRAACVSTAGARWSGVPRRWLTGWVAWQHAGWLALSQRVNNRLSHIIISRPPVIHPPPTVVSQFICPVHTRHHHASKHRTLYRDIRISTDILWRILTEPVQCGPALRYSVDLRIQAYRIRNRFR